MSDKKVCLFPKGRNELGSTAHSTQGSSGMVTELVKGLWAEVGQFMVLPVPPQILHRIELRGIGRQMLKHDSAILPSHKVLNQPTTMTAKPIPDHQHFPWDMAYQVAEELNHLGTSDRSGIQTKVKTPPTNPRYRRKRLPVKRVLQHWSLSLRGPCPAPMGTLAKAALINENYRTSLPLGFFLSSGQRFFFHRSMASSSLCKALPVGRWQLHPNRAKSHPTWPGWYFTPQIFSISSATRLRVHRLVSYPNVSGPRFSAFSIRLRSPSFSRDLRPARPAFLSPPRPCCSICFNQRFTDWRCTSTCRATSASHRPCLSKPNARKRRFSKTSKFLLTPAGFPMQETIAQMPPIVTIFYEDQ